MSAARGHVVAPSSCTSSHASALHSVPQRFMWVSGTNEAKTVSVPALYLVGDSPPSLRLFVSPQTSSREGTATPLRHLAETSCVTAPPDHPSLATSSTPPLRFAVAVHRDVGRLGTGGGPAVLGTGQQPGAPPESTNFPSALFTDRVRGGRSLGGVDVEFRREVTRQVVQQRTWGGGGAAAGSEIPASVRRPLGAGGAQTGSVIEKASKADARYQSQIQAREGFRHGLDSAGGSVLAPRASALSGGRPHLGRIDFSSTGACAPAEERPRAANVVPTFSARAFGEQARTARSFWSNPMLESRRLRGEQGGRESGRSEMSGFAEDVNGRSGSGKLVSSTEGQPLVFRKHIMSPRERPSTVLDGNKYFTWVGALHTTHNQRISPRGDCKRVLRVQTRTLRPEERAPVAAFDRTAREREMPDGSRARTPGAREEQRLLEFRAGDDRSSGRRRVRVQSDREVATKLKEQLVEAVPGRVAVWVRQGQRLRTPRDSKLGQDGPQGSPGVATPVLVYTYVLRYLPVEALQNVIVDNRALVLASAVQKPGLFRRSTMPRGISQVRGQITSPQTPADSALGVADSAAPRRAVSPLFRRREPHVKQPEVFTVNGSSFVSSVRAPHSSSPAQPLLPDVAENQFRPPAVRSSTAIPLTGDISGGGLRLFAAHSSRDAAGGPWSQPLWPCCFEPTATPRAATVDTHIRRQFPPSLLASSTSPAALASPQLQGILVTVPERRPEELEPSVRVRGVLLPSGSHRGKNASAGHANGSGSVPRITDEGVRTQGATSSETQRSSEESEQASSRFTEENSSLGQKPDASDRVKDLAAGGPAAARRTLSESSREKCAATAVEDCKRCQSSDSFCPTHLFETSSVPRGNPDWLPPLLDSRLLRPEGTDACVVPLPQRRVEYFYLDRSSTAPKHGTESPALHSARESQKEGASDATGTAGAALLSQDVSDAEGSVAQSHLEGVRTSAVPVGGAAATPQRGVSHRDVSETRREEKPRSGGGAERETDKEKTTLCRRRATCEIYSIEDEVASDRASLPSSRTSDDGPCSVVSRSTGPMKTRRDRSGDLPSPTRAMSVPAAAGRAGSHAPKAENCPTLPPNENDVEEWLLISGASLSMVLGSMPVGRRDISSRSANRDSQLNPETLALQEHDAGGECPKSQDNDNAAEVEARASMQDREKITTKQGDDDSQADPARAPESGPVTLQEATGSLDEKKENMRIPSEEVETVTQLEERLLPMQVPPVPSFCRTETGPGTREAGQIGSVVRALQEMRGNNDRTEESPGRNREISDREEPDSAPATEVEGQTHVSSSNKMQNGSVTPHHSKKKPAELEKVEEEEESTDTAETPCVKALAKKWSRGMSGSGGQVRRKCSSHLSSPRARGHERIGSIDASDDGVAGVYARFGNVAERYLQNLKKSSSVLSADETSAQASPRAGGPPLPSPRAGRSSLSSEVNSSEREDRVSQQRMRPDEDNVGMTRQGEPRGPTIGLTSAGNEDGVALD